MICLGSLKQFHFLALPEISCRVTDTSHGYPLYRAGLIESNILPSRWTIISFLYRLQRKITGADNTASHLKLGISFGWFHPSLVSPFLNFP